jgi:hypothetical protein
LNTLFLLVNNHMSESRPESYWTHLYWLTVLEEQKSYTRAAEKLGSASRRSARKSASWSG